MKDYREMAADVLKRRDVYREERRRRMGRMRKTGSILGCFFLVAALGAGAWHWNSTVSGDSPDAGNGERDGDPTGYASIENLTGQKESTQAAGKWEEGQQDSLAEQTQPGQAVFPAGENSETDAPASESPVSTGNMDAYERIWGGSYTDAEGCTVILLTEDTEENRQKVFEMNPNLLEDRTIFREAAYSLEYLTALQEKISDLMAAGELPLVTSSAVLEDANRIRVTMAAEDQETVEKLRALDKTGGAIVTECRAGDIIQAEPEVEEREE